MERKTAAFSSEWAFLFYKPKVPRPWSSDKISSLLHYREISTTPITHHTSATTNKAKLTRKSKFAPYCYVYLLETWNFAPQVGSTSRNRVFAPHLYAILERTQSCLCVLPNVVNCWFCLIFDPHVWPISFPQRYVPLPRLIWKQMRNFVRKKIFLPSSPPSKYQS